MFLRGKLAWGFLRRYIKEFSLLRPLWHEICRILTRNAEIISYFFEKVMLCYEKHKIESPEENF